MDDQNLPLRPWSQRVGQERNGKFPSVFGTLSMAFLCEKFPAQLEEKKSSYKTSDNFSSENFVLVKSADPITETFQNPSHFCHIGQEESQEPSPQCPPSLGMENSSLGAAQSLFRSQQQHFLNIKKLREERKKRKPKEALPPGCFLGIPHPSTLLSMHVGALCFLPGGPDPLTPGWSRGDRMDGRLFPAQGAGWGWAVGRRSWAVGLGASREGEGLLLLCVITLPFTHTRSGWNAGGGISPGPPVLAWAASRCQGGQDEALLLLPVQRSGMEGTALQM